MRLREDRQPRYAPGHLARQRIEIGQRLDLVVEQLDAHRVAVRLGREHVDDVAADAVRALREVQFIALVLQLGQPAQDRALVDPVAAHQVQHHAEVGLGVAEPVYRGDRGDNDCVAPFDERLGRRQPHLFNVLVDGGVFLDVSVRTRYVGLRLVIVVVGNEILHRISREEFAHFAIELRGKCLVGREDDRGPLHALDDVGHRVGLAGARDAEQNLPR